MIKNRNILKLTGACLWAICLVIISCDNEETEADDYKTRYFCDAEEKIQTEDNRLLFDSDNMQFKSAETQSSDYAFKGEYSVKLDSVHKYGMSFILTGIEQGEFFQASVWQKETDTPGSLICSVTGNATFTINSVENGFYERQDGWMKHVLQFRAITNLDSVTFFLFAGGDGEVAYFDELEVACQRFVLHLLVSFTSE